ncbi:MAG: cation diffusion facilitator family transporter [Candidatus Micrarchaeia archaeon]
MFKGRLGAANAVVVVNVALLFVKCYVALITGSISVLATLVDSGFDLLGGVLAWLGIKQGGVRRDADHHYGHEQVENLYSLGQLALIGVTSFLIVLEALRRLYSGELITVNGTELALMVVAVIAPLGLYFYLTREHAEHGGAALEAAKNNYFSDVLQNSAVLAGLFFVQIGFPQADSFAAMLVAALMFRVVVVASKKPVDELLDASPSPEKMCEIRECIESFRGINGFENLRSRTIDGRICIDARLKLHPKQSVAQAQATVAALKRKLKREVPGVKEALFEI